MSPCGEVNQVAVVAAEVRCRKKLVQDPNWMVDDGRLPRGCSGALAIVRRWAVDFRFD